MNASILHNCVEPTTVLRRPDELFAPSLMNAERRGDGSIVMRSPLALERYDRCIGDWLIHWAAKTPDTEFLLERGADGNWNALTYREALASVRRIGAWLLARELSVDRPLCILSDNSIEHALLALAAMHVGIPAIPVSPAYSLMSSDFGKLRAIVQLARPGAIFVSDAGKFSNALQAAKDLHDGLIIVGAASAPTDRAHIPFATALTHTDGAEVDRAFAAVDSDTIAKILFTSGSTGEPKGVINTQRMLCSNQQALRQIWPFTRQQPPILVDWLPWNHTFGGNFDFNLVLCNGGTLYIDAGRPMPGLFDKTVANLREISPTIQFNVPRGYDMLVSALRADAALRRNFFSRLQMIFYAAASLPPHVWDALNELSEQTLGERVTLTSAWGSTETSPLAAACHYQAERPGVIGTAIPGTELKLVPSASKLEVRVRGPNVTPGYWKRPTLTADAFDDEGFYKIGDAVRFVDVAQPNLGVVFDGRVAEDFKLASGTWVSVGALRVKAIAALAPVAQDIVLAGHDREEICFLIFPNVAACRTLCNDSDQRTPIEHILAHPSVREKVLQGLLALRADGKGSSTYAVRAVLMTDAPSIDRGEINDKGYINQGAVLRWRHELVTRLYDSPDHPSIVALR